MNIRKGSPKSLRKARGKHKVWKKTNQWFFCASCITMVYFRVFKCRFDWERPILCDCGATLIPAPKKLYEEAKIIRPHFYRHKDKKTSWYYDVYLKSDLWKQIRQRILQRDGGECQRCHDKAVVVHHKSYTDDVLAGNSDQYLVSLCIDCHDFIEFDGKRKTSLDEANERLLITP